MYVREANAALLTILMNALFPYTRCNKPLQVLLSLYMQPCVIESSSYIFIFVIIFRARNLSICLSFSRFALFLLFFIIMGREDYIKYLRLFVMQIIYILSLTPPPPKLRIIQGHIINHCQYV